jgi:hypothetical protein
VQSVTVADIAGRIITRIDDNPAAPVSVVVGTGPTIGGVVVADEVLGVINEGHQLAALLTLCLEKTVPYSLSAATVFYTPRSTLTDFLVPLRITVAGVRLRPSRIDELDAWNPAWQATAGTAERYCTLGCNLLAVTPQQTATAQITHAYSPAALAAAGTPVIPPSYHQALVEYGVYRCRLKEGAQQLARGLGSLNVFLDAMTELGDYVRTRSKAARYDVLPFELALYDRSGLIDKILKRQAANLKA